MVKLFRNILLTFNIWGYFPEGHLCNGLRKDAENLRKDGINLFGGDKQK